MELLSQIIGGVFGGGVVAMLIGVIYKKLNAQVEANTKDIKGVKENYIDRFEKVNKGISDLKVSIAKIETKICGK